MNPNGSTCPSRAAKHSTPTHTASRPCRHSRTNPAVAVVEGAAEGIDPGQATRKSLEISLEQLIGVA
jgi:hypothetical protein